MSKSGKQVEDNKIANSPAGAEPRGQSRNFARQQLLAENFKSLPSTSAATGRADRGFEAAAPNKPKGKTTRSMQLTQSDGSLIRAIDNVGLKQKLVNKVKSWNNKDGKILQYNETAIKDAADLISDFEGLTLSPDASEDNLFKSDWLRAKDSLENLLSPRNDKSEIVNSKSTHFPSQEKTILNESSPSSESQLGNSKTINSVSKVLAWDPWDKLGRKNKKDNKRRKFEKSSSENAMPRSNKDHTSGDELRNGESSSNGDNANQDSDDYMQNYEYQPYHGRNMKAVEFTNEVMVVYITGDEVVGESTEPLKKELEQQIRNKEMRRGHCPTTLFGKRNFDEDYMSAWLKK